MDPVSAMGMASSVLALVGVAIKVAHHLDILKEKWSEAALKIISLRTQIGTFEGALEELYNWMSKNNDS